MEKIFYTDGGCEPNPGNGVWAFICVDPHVEFSGSEINTTSNRMELTAAIKATEYSIELHFSEVKIYTDSKYLANGFNDWMHGWIRNGWYNSFGEKVKNRDLWKHLYQYWNKKISIEWIKGHNGHEFNELADQLTRDEYEKSFGGEMKY